MVAFAFVLAGDVLHAILGPRFIFFHADPYASVGWLVFIALLPVFGAAMFHERARVQTRLRYPTRWIRWLMYPLGIAAGSGAVVIAPLGWIAALTLATGSDTGPVVGRLSSVAEYRSSVRGCDQRGELVVAEHGASVCLERLTTLPAKGNASVVITASRSRFGLLIKSISAQ